MKHRWAVAAACWIGCVATLGASQIRVTPLVDNGRVFVSLAAPDVMTSDLQEIVRSGLLLTLTYSVELRRPSTIWFDPTLGRALVGASAKYDSLTGKYHVDRIQDGKIVSSKVSDQETELRTLLTEFEKVPLETTGALEANGDYYVRVRLHTSPRTSFSLWSLWPWSEDAGSGRASFTYLR